MGELAIMDRTGDTKVIWNPENTDETETARETFRKLRAKGYLAYTVDPKDGSKATQMIEFDPNAGKVILAPAPRGG